MNTFLVNNFYWLHILSQTLRSERGQHERKLCNSRNLFVQTRYVIAKQNKQSQQQNNKKTVVGLRLTNELKPPIHYHHPQQPQS